MQWEDPVTKEFLQDIGKDYYPEAFINMLAFLGWNPGTSKMYSLDELIQDFSLRGLVKLGKFDLKKQNGLINNI